MSEKVLPTVHETRLSDDERSRKHHRGFGSAIASLLLNRKRIQRLGSKSGLDQTIEHSSRD